MNWIEGGTGVPVMRSELNPMIVLAALDSPPKRQDMLESKGAIAVIYPDIGEPFRSVFAKIIEGIEEQAKVRVKQLPDRTEQQYGRPERAAEAQRHQGSDRPRTPGAEDRIRAGPGHCRGSGRRALGPRNGEPQPDWHQSDAGPGPAVRPPEKNCSPAQKKVTVIYDPQHNEWLLKLAREAAKAQGLELVAHEARDLASAARLYEAAFATADSRFDAVWLPQDSTTVDEDTILPLILKESWNRGVPVFSSSFLHVKKGALFALYPNNVGLGHDLANFALGVLAGEPRKRGMSPLREVLTAVNLRTASHIGLNIGYQQQRSFDFVFPEP
ncbi:ABC transporter substrate binding protein [Undibacterium arcticum]